MYPYQWHMSPEWNEENAQKYQILYTTNFHIAAELNPLPGAQPDVGSGGINPQNLFLQSARFNLSKVEIKKLNRQLRPLIAVLVVMVLSLLVMLGILSLPHLFPWMAVSVGASGSGGVSGCSQGSVSWLGEVRSTS